MTVEKRDGPGKEQEDHLDEKSEGGNECVRNGREERERRGGQKGYF